MTRPSGPGGSHVGDLSISLQHTAGEVFQIKRSMVRTEGDVRELCRRVHEFVAAIYDDHEAKKTFDALWRYYEREDVRESFRACWKALHAAADALCDCVARAEKADPGLREYLDRPSAEHGGTNRDLLKKSVDMIKVAGADLWNVDTRLGCFLDPSSDAMSRCLKLLSVHVDALLRRRADEWREVSDRVREALDAFKEVQETTTRYASRHGYLQALTLRNIHADFAPREPRPGDWNPWPEVLSGGQTQGEVLRAYVVSAVKVVRKLVESGAAGGKNASPEIKLIVSGEHAGEPDCEDLKTEIGNLGNAKRWGKDALNEKRQPYVGEAVRRYKQVGRLRLLSDRRGAEILGLSRGTIAPLLEKARRGA